MKISLHVSLALSLIGVAASSKNTLSFNNGRRLAFSATSPTTSSAKDELLSYAKQLKEESKTGVFLTDFESKSQLKKLVAELESSLDDSPVDQSALVGDWNLLCTTASPTGFDNNIPEQGKSFFANINSFVNENLSNPLNEKIRESVNVVQRVRTSDESSTTAYDRVDNVIEFTPFSLEDIFNIKDNLSNPLQVSKSKVSLVHSAECESVSPVLRTKLVLKSIILTVAGKSQYLEPEGADVLGLNVPLGDLFNFGNFDTTYVDENMRVSRSKVGLVEQLRVFIKEEDDSDVTEENEIIESESESEETVVAVEEEGGEETVAEVEETVEEVVEEETPSVEEDLIEEVIEEIIEEIVEEDVAEDKPEDEKSD